MKKRNTFVALALCIAMTLGLVGCSSSSESTTASTTTTTGTTTTTTTGDTTESVTSTLVERKLSMGTGSSSGAWFILGGGIGNVVTMESDYFEIVAEVSSGGTENLRNLADDITDLCMLNNDYAYYYYTSTDIYDGVGSDQLRSLITLPPSTMHVVVSDSSGITCMADLVGKKVAVGTAGSGYESFACKLIESCGMTYDDMTVQMVAVSQMPDLMKNGQIDAFFLPVQDVSGTLTDLLMSANAHMISLTDDIVDNFLNETMGYVPNTIPAGTYPGQDTEIITAATGQCIVTLAENFTEEEMYTLMHDIFDNSDDWINIHESASQITLEASDTLPIPLHSGAYKFYVEAGVDVADELVPPEAN